MWEFIPENAIICRNLKSDYLRKPISDREINLDVECVMNTINGILAATRIYNYYSRFTLISHEILFFRPLPQWLPAPRPFCSRRVTETIIEQLFAKGEAAAAPLSPGMTAGRSVLRARVSIAFACPRYCFFCCKRRPCFRYACLSPFPSMYAFFPFLFRFAIGTKIPLLVAPSSLPFVNFPFPSYLLCRRPSALHHHSDSAATRAPFRPQPRRAIGQRRLTGPRY